MGIQCIPILELCSNLSNISGNSSSCPYNVTLNRPQNNVVNGYNDLECDWAILINRFKTEVATGDNLIFLIIPKLCGPLPTITRPNIPMLPCGVQPYK